MSILDILGKQLSLLVGKEPLACKGLIRFASKDLYGDRNIETLDVDELKNVINNSLINRLQKVKVPNPENVANTLTKTLIKNVSVMTFNF